MVKGKKTKYEGKKEEIKRGSIQGVERRTTRRRDNNKSLFSLIEPYG